VSRTNHTSAIPTVAGWAELLQRRARVARRVLSAASRAASRSGAALTAVRSDDESATHPNSVSITCRLASWLLRESWLPIGSAVQSLNSKHR
jgi:hypothetical protein